LADRVLGARGNALRNVASCSGWPLSRSEGDEQRFANSAAP